MSAADELRALTAAATPGPWRAYKYGVIGSGDLRNGDVCGDYQDDMRWDDKALIVWLVNHADALADLIEWAANDAEHHPQCTIDDCRCGLDEALAALDADR